MRALLLSLLLAAAVSLGAAPVITSISPSEGPVQGGTVVIIRGSGFNDVCIVCSPPFGGLSVFFGAERAVSVRLVNENRIEAATPPGAPGPVTVTVQQLDASPASQASRANGFTYVGLNEVAGYEPILFPVFLPPVRGAFGSEFHTTARVVSKGEPLDLYGVDASCIMLGVSPPIVPGNPFRIGSTPIELPTACSQSVGRLFYVTREGNRARDLAANLRVADVARLRDSLGVEVPVVREDEFTTSKIVLLAVPIDPRFRNLLRIYGLPRVGANALNVTINGVTTMVTLRRGETQWEPSYAEFANFPSGTGTVTVTIEDPLGGRGIVPPTPFWAMVSVTNNETQQITLVTPN
ncbi:MAG TPA: IPT/TIG domain-containing protein [Thermoanaerobaculia bacterium]|jgi:hypothetical protein|nr:IPT/TIG domain-containing protein [Thermoanaerobaculia bacterium]